MSAPDLLNRHSLAGFYKSPICKCFAGWFGLTHIALHVPMFRAAQRYIVCKIPDSLAKREFWRLFTSKLCFIDTKDAVLAAILIYYFRTFERRFGTSRFFTYLLTSFLFSTCIEAAVTFALTYVAESVEFTGLLAVGPFSVIFCLFIPFFFDIPKLSSATFGGVSMSSKVLPYFAALHILSTSKANVIAGLSGIVSGLLARHNFLYLRSLLEVPKRAAAIAHKFFGQWVESGPPLQGMMGATLEIQRSQQMEAIEQQILRQQARFGGRQHQQLPRGAGGAGRAQIGQGFAERLVDQDAAGFGAFWGRGAQGGGGGGGGNQRREQQQAVAPSEPNIRMLTDMGFSRERAVNALRRTNDNVESATTYLLQEPQ